MTQGLLLYKDRQRLSTSAKHPRMIGFCFHAFFSFIYLLFVCSSSKLSRFLSLVVWESVHNGILSNIVSPLWHALVGIDIFSTTSDVFTMNRTRHNDKKLNNLLRRWFIRSSLEFWYVSVFTLFFIKGRWWKSRLVDMNSFRSEMMSKGVIRSFSTSSLLLADHVP